MSNDFFRSLDSASSVSFSIKNFCVLAVFQTLRSSTLLAKLVVEISAHFFLSGRVLLTNVDNIKCLVLHSIVLRCHSHHTKKRKEVKFYFFEHGDDGENNQVLHLHKRKYIYIYIKKKCLIKNPG